MSDLPNEPRHPGGGSRAEKAAQLKAEMEAEAEAPMAAKTEEEDQLAAAEQAHDEPVGQGQYVVKEGDCISSIAKDTGHLWESIWNDPANAELKAVREDPNLLMVGDRVTIPELQPKEEPGETEMRHRFVRRGEPAKLSMELVDEGGDPLANRPYTLEVDGQAMQGTTDAQGKLEHRIPGNARRAKLRIEIDVGDGEMQEQTYEWPLGVIHPADTVRGAQWRLNNLEYDCGVADGKLGEKTEDALARFQEEHDLEVTGRLDGATVAKLKEVHGC